RRTTSSTMLGRASLNRKMGASGDMCGTSLPVRLVSHSHETSRAPEPDATLRIVRRAVIVGLSAGLFGALVLLGGSIQTPVQSAPPGPSASAAEPVSS